MGASVPDLPLPPALARRSGDPELVARFRAGDESAFAEIHRRHRPGLVRFAARILGARRQAAEDVVQEALARAHTALRETEREIHLRPWLQRLVRNRCLDELRRGMVSLALDEALDAAPGDGGDPFHAVARRQRLRLVVEDIAALPERQRDVLLRRELEGATHERIAADLGITVRASKNLAGRARENLLKREQARSDSCLAIRADLLHAHELRRRASARSYRHLSTCRECRRFRAHLGELRSALRILTPGPLLLPLAALAGGWSLTGGSTGGTVLKATTVVAVATGGAVELARQVVLPGERSPVAVASAVLPAPLTAGAPVPPGTGLVTHEVTLHPDTTRHPRLELPCPPGMRVAGLTPDRGASIGYGYSSGTLIGTSRTARIVFEPHRVARRTAVTVGTLCKRPDATGSLLALPAFSKPDKVRRVCARRAYLYETPNRFVVGTVFRGQPVRVKREDRSGRWTRIVTDAGVRGWVRSRVLSRRGSC